MPLWLETLVPGLLFYAAGLAIGWALWGRSLHAAEDRGRGDAGAAETDL